MIKRILTLLTLCVLLVGCKDDSPAVNEDLSIDNSQLTVVLDNGESSMPVRFTARQIWTATIATNTSSDQWCSISPTSGNVGDATMYIEAGANTTGDDRSLTILLKAGATEKTITVSQPSQEVLKVAQTSYRIGLEGGVLEIPVSSNVQFTCTIKSEDQSWIEQIESAPANAPRAAVETTNLRLNIKAGDTDHSSVITLASTNSKQDVIITRAYESTDFSADGTVITLQTATEGNGITLIFMGDAFSDRDIAGGLYRETMTRAMNAFFGEEPYTTFRKLFNVYAVNVVSKNGSYFDGAETALKGAFTTTTIVSGNDQQCKFYAMKTPGMSNAKLDDSLIIVMMNRKYYAGTCYMYLPTKTNDYSSGLSIAYFPLGTDDAVFEQILHHEAGGHGFPKLGDEYFYPANGRIPQSGIDAIKEAEPYGWYKNNDFTTDPKVVKWSKFIADERYVNEKVGVFEGADTYAKGIYRPTDTGIMRVNTGGFNAPSREAIYYRIHKLAYGRSWVYKYEDFVTYDEVNRNKPANAQRISTPQNFVPLGSPVVRKQPL